MTENRPDKRVELIQDPIRYTNMHLLNEIHNEYHLSFDALNKGEIATVTLSINRIYALSEELRRRENLKDRNGKLIKPCEICHNTGWIREL